MHLSMQLIRTLKTATNISKVEALGRMKEKARTGISEPPVGLVLQSEDLGNLNLL